MAQPHEEQAGRNAGFSPGTLLAMFCSMNLLIYIDRGLISSSSVNGRTVKDGGAASGIMGDFDLTLFQDGLLPSAFLVGLLASSPIFAEAVKHYNCFKLIGVGLSVWAAATAGCGLTWGFGSLLVCRMVVGVGEASFVAIAAAVIDDAAPAAAKTRWLASFYLCIPVGYAAGYILGGAVAGPLGWRAGFLLEAAAMLPFALLCLFGRALDLKGKPTDPDQRDRPEGAGSTIASFLRDQRTIWSHPVYALAVAGSAVYTGVLGAFAYYGPKAGREVFDLKAAEADVLFGAVTVTTGVVGTLLGGVVLDRLGSSMANAMQCCAWGVGAGCVCLTLAFGAARSLMAFISIFALGQLGLFFIGAPQNAIVLWSVPPLLRPFAMSMQLITIHVLGDVPSAPALSLLQSRLHNWRLSMAFCSLFLLLAALLFLVGMVKARKAPDYRRLAVGDHVQTQGDDIHSLSSQDEGSKEPLLDDVEHQEQQIASPD